MGWWWSSSPSNQTSSPPNHQSPSTTTPFPEAVPTETSKPPIQPSRSLTRDELADRELQSFLAEFQDSRDDERPSGPPPKPSETSSTTQQLTQETPQRSIAPESLYPTTMSCRQAFDYAFFCQSLGGQWVNVYRYGELRSCSEHWGDFWFCMQMRSYKKGEQQKMIRDRYRKKAIKYKTGPSSEDVWELRKEPLEGAFQGDYESFEKEMKEKEKEENNG